VTLVTGSSALCLKSQIFSTPQLASMGETELCVMMVFPLGFTRSLEWFEVHFLRWRRPAHLELEDESDEELKDIGIAPSRRDFDAVKPFWMP
jgi:uncharacterized protein YjiS (DUF1127 family)